MKRKLIICLCFLGSIFSTKAQSGFEEVIKGGTNDAKKLLTGYFAPAMEGMIFSINNGWAHTAKVHKVLGFDISIGVTGSIFSEEHNNFTVENLEQFNQASGKSYTGSTLVGDDDGGTLILEKDGQTITVDMPGSLVKDLNLPIKILPLPVVQLNVGLPFKTEALIRFVPETDLGDEGGKVKMYGIGLKKEITSWFGPLDKLPLHVSILGAYTSLKLNYLFGDSTSDDFTIEKGSADFDLTAYNVQAIASLNFPFINLYGSVGYSSGESNFKMGGNYHFDKGGANEERITPPDFAFSASGFKTGGGVRLSLGFLKIFADYTFQEYNMVNLGVALSIR